MSDNWIQFVSTDPAWQPTAAASEAALAILKAAAPLATEVEAEFYDAVTFFHPGTNWSGVACPNCASEIEDWWDDAMNEAAERQFASLQVVTPCCGAQTSLNDLAYHWPAAFGRYYLEAMNPNIGEGSPELQHRLSEALGSPLRKVLVHI